MESFVGHAFLDTLTAVQNSTNSTTDSPSEHHGNGGPGFFTGIVVGVLVAVIFTLIIRCCTKRVMKKKGWKLCKHGATNRSDVEQALLAQSHQYVIPYPAPTQHSSYASYIAMQQMQPQIQQTQPQPQPEIQQQQAAQ